MTMVSRYAPETRNQGQVEVEDILEPLDGRSRLVGQDLDQVGTSLVARRLEGIFVELLDAILDTKIGLRPREGTVNTGCGFGGVATEEVCAMGQNRQSTLTKGKQRTLLVQNKDVSTVQVDSVSGTQARHCDEGHVSNQQSKFAGKTWGRAYSHRRRR